MQTEHFISSLGAKKCQSGARQHYTFTMMNLFLNTEFILSHNISWVAFIYIVIQGEVITVIEYAVLRIQRRAGLDDASWPR